MCSTLLPTHEDPLGKGSQNMGTLGSAGLSQLNHCAAEQQSHMVLADLSQIKMYYYLYNVTFIL